MTLPYRRIRGYADYALTTTGTHADETSYRHRNDLRAGLNAELIESHAFLDLAADYGIQLGSVFESPERSLLVQNDNRVEGGRISVAPSLRTRLGDGGRAEARAEDSTTKFRGSSTGDVHSQAGTLLIDSGVRPRAFTWKGTAYGAVYDFEAGRRTTEASVRGDAGWAFDGETVTSVVAGREGNDFESSNGRVYNNLYGVTVDYRPNQRTHLYAEATQRFFGVGHTLSLTYRLPQFALMASSTRASTRPGIGLENSNAFSSGSAYDVLYLQLESREPNPDKRRLLVQDLLAANGIDPGQPVVPNVVTSGVVLVEGHTVGATWTGVRNTIVLSVSGGSSRRLDSLLNLPLNDNLRTEDRIDQVGVQAGWIRRLNPIDSLSFAYEWNRAEGDLTLRVSKYQSAQVHWSRSIGAQSTLVVGLTHREFADTSGATDYTVNIVSCRYQFRF